MRSTPSRAGSLDAHRLDQGTISAGCIHCPLLAQCGGYTRTGGGWSCMDRCAACDASCDLVCLKKPAEFTRALLEVGGFDHRSIPPLKQPSLEMPRYVPVLQRGIAVAAPLEWAAVPLNGLMKYAGRRYGPIAENGDALRARLGLASETKIVLLGTGKDRLIETYWRWRRLHDVPSVLGQVDLWGAIAPNYSLFLEDPRPQHLFNRKRSLLCAAEWSAAGVPPVPYLHAVTVTDWQFWHRFLREHSEVTYVAKEFQTGLSNTSRGIGSLDEIARLQDQLGRPLHLVAVGAAKYRSHLAARFDRWSVIDSMPFMKAIKRRAAGSRTARRVNWEKALGEDVGDLLYHNVAVYERWIGMARTARPMGVEQSS